MNARLGKVCKKVQNVIERIPDDSVLLKDLRLNGEPSVVGVLQMYREKSQILLTAGAIDFSPFPIMLLNVSKIFRRSDISSERSKTAYLPRRLFSEDGTSND